MKKQLTTHAATAKAIKQELKKAFPLIKFKVRSDSFAGGDSVHIEWENGPTDKALQAIVGKYQYGHFDGMQDLYEHTNRRDDIPQVKYVQIRREITKEIKEQIFKEIQQTHAHFDKVKSLEESSSDLLKHWSVWTAENFIYRLTVNVDLTNGYKSA